MLREIEAQTGARQCPPAPYTGAMPDALTTTHVTVDQPLDLPLTLESGQAFRWHDDGGVWSGFIEGRLLTLERDPNGPATSPTTPAHLRYAERAVRGYFRLDDDLPAIYAQLCEDERLSAAVHRHWGLRILRQDPWECLIAFICSQNSNIPRIAKMQETLANTLGATATLGPLTQRAFPTPEALASAGEARLRELGLGYRARYVAGTSEVVAAGGLDLLALRAAPYEDAKAALVALPGVGEKVADCVLLFALDQLDAAPDRPLGAPRLGGLVSRRPPPQLPRPLGVDPRSLRPLRRLRAAIPLLPPPGDGAGQGGIVGAGRSPVVPAQAGTPANATP